MKSTRNSFAILSILGWIIVAIVWSVMPVALGARAGDPSAIEAAEQRYAEAVELTKSDPDAARARFAAAAELYAAIAGSAESSGPLRYNHANALLQAGRLGPAIAEYRAALRRAPADSRIAHNLAEARAKVTRSPGVPPATTLERAASIWSVVGEGARWLATVLLVWLAIGLVIFVPRARPAALVASVVAALIGCTVALDLVRRASDRSAVLGSATTLRKGNGEGFDPLYAEPLPEGTECRIAETRPGWIRIELSDSSAGWVREDALIRVP